MGSEEYPQLRLINTDDISGASRTSLRYITLSHKWGEANFLTLTLSNRLELEHGIGFAELSQNFKDAVLITRRLGYRYLWIDSLCIIQDSITDWELEAKVMHQVYQNSFLNIAASEADGHRQGLLKQKDPSHWSSFRVRFKTNTLEEDYLCFLDAWEYIKYGAPLNRRGWVLQERLLSPRTIHFASPIYWECRELVACPARSWNYSINNQWYKFNKIWPSFDSSIRDALRLWESCLARYTECLLTKSSDKLIAISGIARTMHRVIKGNYTAGLWDQHLIRGLTWIGTKDSTGLCKSSQRAESYRGMI